MPKRWNSHSASSELSTRPPANESTLKRAARRQTMPRDGPSGASGFCSSACGSGNRRYSSQTATPTAAYSTNMSRSASSIVTFHAKTIPAARPRARRTRRTSSRGSCSARTPTYGPRALREHRVVERHEDAGVAAARVERADERDEEQRPERRQPREAQSRRGHQHGCREEQAPDGEAVSPAADGERGQRRAEERRRAEEADLELGHAERQQIRRQHDGDEAVGEGAQRAGGEDEADHFTEP